MERLSVDAFHVWQEKKALTPQRNDVMRIYFQYFNHSLVDEKFASYALYYTIA